MKRLLLVGGGHTHVEVLRRLGLRPLAGVDITLVNPSGYAAYSGMLPGLIAGHYRFHECHIDLARVAQFAGARFLSTWARGVDTERALVSLADGSTVGYDVVSFNVGAGLASAATVGAPDNVILVKPAEALLQAWNTILERAHARRLQKLVVVGGGAAGVEILLAMQYRLSRLIGSGAVRFALVSDDRLLSAHNSRVQAEFQSLLETRNVEIFFNTRVACVDVGTAISDTGLGIAADAFVWATGAAANRSLQMAGLARDKAGFIAVNEHLQSLSHPEAFAAGDCATIRGYSYPKSGVYAVRQGPCLARNLRRALSGEPLAAYQPQRRALALISSGGKHAVASYGPLALSGAWVWNWKDRVDRRFVAKYNALA